MNEQLFSISVVRDGGSCRYIGILCVDSGTSSGNISTFINAAETRALIVVIQE